MKAKRSLTLALALALTASLSAPAFAAEGQYLVDGSPVPTISADAEPADYITVVVSDLAEAGMDPAYIEVSLEEESVYPSYYEFIQEYFAAHPEHYAAFDADGFYALMYGDWYTKEEYMADMDLADEEAFRQDMWDMWLGSYSYEYNSEVYELANDAYYARLMEVYSARHPGELEALTTEDLLARQGYTQTLTPMEQYMEYWDLDSEDQVRSSLLHTYITDRIHVEQVHADYLVYAESWPDELAAFDASAYFVEEYPWYDSKAEYMQIYGLLTYEEFSESMFVEYVEQHYWEWDHEDEVWTDPDDWYYPDEEPKPLTLVVNGQLMEDAVISAEDGWSYASVPTINAIFDQHNVDDGEMKPLRAAAEEAGWDVGWNERNNTLFLLDGETLKARYAESMAALDTMMDWAMEHANLKEGQSYKTTETMDVTITMLDSLDGDKDYKLGLTMEVLQRDGVIEMTVTVNAADLLRLLGDDLVEAITAELPKFTAKDLKNLLGGIKFNAILDLNQGNFYFNLPILASFDKTIQENTWYALTTGEGLGMTPQELAADLPGLLADMFYQELLNDSARAWSGPEEVFGQSETAVTLLNAIAGPDTLKKSGSTVTWSVDTETINQLYSDLLGVEATPFKVYELKYVMKGDGSFTADVSVRPDMRGLADASISSSGYGNPLLSILTGRFLGLFDFQVTAHSAGTADKATGEMDFHLKNSFKVHLDTDAVQKPVKDAPAAVPPEGAVIVEM